MLQIWSEKNIKEQSI